MKTINIRNAEEWRESKEPAYWKALNEYGKQGLLPMRLWPTQTFSVIYADPPWSFKSWSDKGKNRAPDALVRQKGLSERHYKVMDLSAIAALPVQRLAKPDCILFLWAVDCMLPEALQIGTAWGFKYKTIAFTWRKLVKDGSRDAIGLGYWTRGNTENCLLFTRGNPQRKSASVRQIINSPRREHSRKPDAAYERILELCGDVPRIELFARGKAQPNWNVWGDQAIENNKHP